MLHEHIIWDIPDCPVNKNVILTGRSQMVIGAGPQPVIEMEMIDILPATSIITSSYLACAAICARSDPL
jgi:hypothetical protein